MWEAAANDVANLIKDLSGNKNSPDGKLIVHGSSLFGETSLDPQGRNAIGGLPLVKNA